MLAGERISRGQEVWLGDVAAGGVSSPGDDEVVVHLAVAMHAVKNRVSGTLVRARLCRRSEGLVYVLTVLGHDGKVARAVVDAVKGTLVGGL